MSSDAHESTRESSRGLSVTASRETEEKGLLWDISAVKHFKIAATDGDLGEVKDILFEDDKWRIRWVVVETGSWFSNHKILVHRSNLGDLDIAARRLHVKLTKMAVQNSRTIEADLPVSQQPLSDIPAEYREVFEEDRIDASRQVPIYPELLFMSPAFMMEGTVITEQKGDAHLRSAETLTGFHIHATDGDIGHVADFIFEDRRWHIRYLVVDTHNWLPSRKILLPPTAVVSIDWRARVIEIDATRAQVKSSPPYDSEMTIDRLYEEIFYAHYGWMGYWM